MKKEEARLGLAEWSDACYSLLCDSSVDRDFLSSPVISNYTILYNTILLYYSPVMDSVSHRNLTLSLLIRTIKVLIFLVTMKGE